MATKIVTKNSSTASAAPTASDLVQGELAVNVTDKRLYTENNAGAIVELGTNPLGAVTMASTLAVTGNVDFNGDLDVDGTSNLDVIDVDGAANFAADVTFADGADIITASAGTSNFRAGVNAGNSITSGGNYNVVVGDEAGTALTTGDENVAVGYAALDNSNVGSFNTAIGKSALGNDTKGSRNTAVGNSALQTQNFTSATNSYNTAMGFNAGTAVTTGIQNTFVGGLSGDSATTSSFNTAVGYNALGACTTGANNTVVGRGAGDAITTATNSVAVGDMALGGHTTGTANTAVGSYCLAGVNMTGGYNTAMGQNCGANVTTGTNNSFFGWAAGDAVTTASNNTAMGHLSLSGATTGASNVAIGGNALTATTTGSQNVAVGRSAGTVTTTGSGNTCLGHGINTASAVSNYNLVAGYNSSAASAGNGWATFGYNNTRTYISLGNTSWSGTSDSRLKENVADHTLGLGFINALRPVTYNWKKKKDVPSELSDYYKEGSNDRVNGTDGLRHGFIAQEVKTVMDSNSLASDSFNLWNTMGDGTQALADGELIPVLTKAIQELSTQLDAALARITTLEG